MGDEYHGEDSPQDYDDEIDRLKQKITDLETEIERLMAANMRQCATILRLVEDEERLRASVSSQKRGENEQ